MSPSTSSGASCVESGPVPDALLQFLDCTPLPTLLWSHPIIALRPHYVNPAADALLAGRHFSSCLDGPDADAFAYFLGVGIDNVRGEDEIELGFVGAGTKGSSSKDAATIRWQATRLEGFTVASALPAAPSVLRYSTPETKAVESALTKLDLDARDEAPAACAEDEHSVGREFLREEQMLDFALMSKFSAVGLVKIDLKGHFCWVNDAWYDIVKHSRDEPLDDWVKLMHPEDAENVMAQWMQALETMTPLNIQYRWANEDTVLVQAQPNHSDPAKATGWVGSVIDVTAQAKAEQAVLAVSLEREVLAQKAVQEAEGRRAEAVEEKKQQELLIDVTSHELRNPISAILQCAELTRTSVRAIRSAFFVLEETGSIPPCFGRTILEELTEDLEALDAIAECAMAQERIANDILGLAQLQLKRYNITPVAFDLLASLRNTCRMFKNECKAKSIDLSLVFGSSLTRLGPHARVHADPTRLAQILINLISNAVRFTAQAPVRKVTVRVEVSAMPPDREGPIIPPAETEYKIEESAPVYLFFSVEDTGPGMTQEASSRLFNRFMQASPLTHVEMGGSGLGLWIARNLCELQLGRVEVESVLGQGSIFRCFIAARSVDAGPISASESQAATIEGITGSNRAASPKTEPAPSADNSVRPRLTVLCCEDNHINRTVLRKQLTKAGHTVLLAEDGQIGLNIYSDPMGSKIDCILMDVEMPILDGLAATRTIRKLEAGTMAKRTRIVGVTGNARPQQIAAALGAGMDDVVTKPYRLEHLLEQLYEPKTSAQEVLEAAVAGEADAGNAAI